MRVPALMTALFLLCAVSPPEPPPIPALLQPYVKDGVFDPGDFGWMRGAFPDASEADKAMMAEAEQWATRCMQESVARTRAQLVGMGIADPRLDASAGAPLACFIFVAHPRPQAGETYAEFRERLDRALPMARTYLIAVDAARDSNQGTAASFSGALIARPLAEQMLRRARFWGQGEMKNAPSLAPGERAIFLSSITMATLREDRANTEWLKNIVAERGWPKISEVGTIAASQAWLMVQHADTDPVFQLQVLRLMEPLVAQGEVSKKNYAYLYDRIMLKLNGKQRYATQMTCDKGKRMPSPLEDEDPVDALRKDMGMSSLADYEKEMDEALGPCPAA